MVRAQVVSYINGVIIFGSTFSCFSIINIYSNNDLAKFMHAMQSICTSRVAVINP